MSKEFTKKETAVAKGLAVLLLLFYHLFHEEYMILEMQVDYRPLSKGIFLMAAGFGNICVAVFVMLTAYGITKSILNVPEMSFKTAYGQAWVRFRKLLIGFVILYLSVVVVWSGVFDLQSLYGKGKQGVILMLSDALGFAQTLGTPTLNQTWWYMSLAYAFIFLIPVLAFCVRKIGSVLLVAAFFLPMVVNLNYDMNRYLFVAVMGVCAAYGNWFEKILGLRLHTVWKWCIGLAGLVLCILVRQNAVVKDYFLNYIDAPIAFFVICFAVILPGNVPGIKQVLGFIGKHSMNIYLVHTFFYLIIHRDLVYGFRYAGLIFAVLTVLSLGYAVILDGLKCLGGRLVSRMGAVLRKKC